MKLKLITLMLLVIMIIVPVMAEDNPFGNIPVNATQEVPVTNATHVNLTQPDISGHFDYVDMAGNTLTSHFGRLVISSTPYIVRNGMVINSVAQISTQDQLKPNQKISGNELTTSYSSGDSIKNRFYRSLMKENITLNSPVQEIGYNYQCYLTDWTITEPYIQFNNTTGMNETVYRNVTSYANNSTVSIDLDQWGNAIIYVNGANTIVLPVPTAIDAEGDNYNLSWIIDKQNNVLRIDGIDNLENAVYPISIDPSNVVTNYGFETGSLTPWTVGHSASFGGNQYYWLPNFTISTNSPHSGTFCAGASGGHQEDSFDFYENVWIQQNVTANPANLMSCYYRIYPNPSSPSGTYLISLRYGSNTRSSSSTSTSWLYLNNSSFSINGTNTFNFNIKASSTWNYTLATDIINFLYYIDDTSLQPSTPVANFTAVPQSGLVPLVVQFNDTSTGNPTSWSWDFGDGSNNSTTHNPVHTYNKTGNYNVSLTVSNIYGSNNTTKYSYITVKDGTNYGETLIQSLTLYENGTNVSGSLIISNNSSENFEGIEIPLSWENNMSEGYMQTESVANISKNSTFLKGVEIPQSSSNNSVKDTLSEKDWKFVKNSMNDLSEEEKNKLINEFNDIIEGKSNLSKDEQIEVCHKVGYYVTLATEGSGIQPNWDTGPSGHEGISRAVGLDLNSIFMTPYVTSEYIDTLGNYSGWADDNRYPWDPLGTQPPLPGLYINRHSWVINGPIIPYSDNYGPDSCEYFMDFARANFTGYDVDSAYVNIGKGLHYIEDLGCPYHTYGGDLPGHYLYEQWASSHWSQLESATNVNTYYIINDPSNDCKAFANFSNRYLDPIDNIIWFGGPDWGNSTDLINDTQILLSQTEKMTMGMHVYASKFESPNTSRGNSVPISDFNTSYAYINDTACSDSIMLPVEIEHSHIGDLEVWLGWCDSSSQMYIEQKIWDRQGGSANKLWLLVHAEGFQDVHNWRLRVVDSAAGDEGNITEFYNLIG